jgi:hypothetical protein
VRDMEINRAYRETFIKFEKSKYTFQVYELKDGSPAFNLIEAASKNPQLAFNVDHIKNMRLTAYDSIVGRERKEVEEIFDNFRTYLMQEGILFSVAETQGVSHHFSCRELIDSKKGS